MPKKLVWVFSKRYIAGETIEDGLLASKLLNEKGIEVTIDLLGEFIKTLGEAKVNRDHYFEIINRFTNENVVGNFSLKPTMFGLLIDKEICYKHLRDIAVSYTHLRAHETVLDIVCRLLLEKKKTHIKNKKKKHRDSNHKSECADHRNARIRALVRTRITMI